MSDKIKIVVEMKTTPDEAKAKQAQVSGLLSLFIGELGYDSETVIDEQIDSYITMEDVQVVDGRFPELKPITVTECRVRSSIEVEVGA